MASIEKRGRRWTVRWRDPDGEQRARSAPDKKTAEALKREVEAAVALGQRWEPRGARPRARLREVADAWLVSCATRIKGSTLRRYGQLIEAFVGWVEGAQGERVGPEVLSVRLLEDWHAHLRSPGSARYGYDLGEATVHKHLVVAQAFWGWAAEREEYDGLVPRARRLDLQAPMAPTREAPTWEDMDAAILAADGWRRELAVVMRCTGLRVSQAMALRKADVDLERSRLTIRGELGKMRPEQRGRVVPLAACLREELAKPRLCAWSDPDWLVSCPHEHRIARSRDVERCWAAAGVAPERWRGRPDHCFRAGFETGLIARGAQWLAVEYLVGHKAPGVLDRYVDPWKALGLEAAVACMPPLPSPQETP